MMKILGADNKGLQAGDMIYSFAGVTSEQGLQAIGALVQRSEDVRPPR
jgi:hypothetical protein